MLCNEAVGPCQNLIESEIGRHSGVFNRVIKAVEINAGVIHTAGMLIECTARERNPRERTPRQRAHVRRDCHQSGKAMRAFSEGR